MRTALLILLLNIIGWAKAAQIHEANSSEIVSITVVSFPTEGGVVSGAGNYEYGSTVMLTATAHSGCRFLYWTKNGTYMSSDAIQISADSIYSLTVTEPGTYVANFDMVTEHYETIGDIVYALYDHTLTACVSGHVNGNNAIGELVIPEVITYGGNNYTVTTIRNDAFYDCSGLTGSLVIPNTVTAIGDAAFDNCTNLSGNLSIPNSVVLIGYSAFRGCLGFTGTLTLSNALTTIGANVFTECSGFTGNLTIPSSVTEIKMGAFSGCSGFTGSLTIPNSVTTIGNGAFLECSGFTGNLVIPNSVTAVGEWAFFNCSGFDGKLTLSKSMTTIEPFTFNGCTGFTGNLIIPVSVTEIGNGAFGHCGGFTGNLTIPSHVTAIGYQAFTECSGFTGGLTIPDEVMIIGDDAFYNCSGFNGNLILGNSVVTIGSGAFSGGQFSACGFTGNLVIPNSVTKIGDAAFAFCYGFTGDLIIGCSVDTIGWYAFSDCYGVDAVVTLCAEPPTIEETSFAYMSPALIVRCGYKDAYLNSLWAGQDPGFSSIEEDCNMYAISVKENNLGNISPSANTAQLGEEILISYTPISGYETDSIIVCKADNESQIVPIHLLSNSELMFIMPNFDVLVKAHFSPLSIEESNTITVNVYPNPTNGQIKFEAADIRHVSINNLLGQTIYEGIASGNEFEYDFSKHDAGIYLIRIKTTNGVVVKKVSVTR